MTIHFLLLSRSDGHTSVFQKEKSDPFQESKTSCDNGLSEKREQPALRVERTYNKALSSKTIKNLSKMLPELWKFYLQYNAMFNF